MSGPVLSMLLVWHMRLSTHSSWVSRALTIYFSKRCTLYKYLLVTSTFTIKFYKSFIREKDYLNTYIQNGNFKHKEVGNSAVWSLESKFEIKSCIIFRSWWNVVLFDFLSVIYLKNRNSWSSIRIICIFILLKEITIETKNMLCLYVWKKEQHDVNLEHS